MVLCNVRCSDAKDCSYGNRKNYTDVLEKVKLHDKSAFYLPRQCLRDGTKALSLLGFLGESVEFTPYLHLWKIGSE